MTVKFCQTGLCDNYNDTMSIKYTLFTSYIRVVLHACHVGFIALFLYFRIYIYEKYCVNQAYFAEL